jgi:hypothetical protein
MQRTIGTLSTLRGAHRDDVSTKVRRLVKADLSGFANLTGLRSARAVWSGQTSQVSQT